MANMRCLGDRWLDSDEVVHLVREAQRGDPHALDALLASLRPMFYLFALPSDGAEDLAQVVLIRVARALGRIDPERAGAFVVTVAENRLRSERRRRGREAQRFVRMERTEGVPAPDASDQEAETNDLARAVDQACRTILRPALREIVWGLLRGLSQSEIAEQYQVPAATVRTRLRRARALLRVELEGYQPESRPR